MNEKEIAAAVEKIVRSSLAEPQKEEHVCRCGSHKMTLEKAKKLAEAVRERAREMGVKAVVAVADKGGNPVLVESMDDAYLASWDVALQKSYTVGPNYDRQILNIYQPRIEFNLLLQGLLLLIYRIQPLMLYVVLVITFYHQQVFQRSCTYMVISHKKRLRLCMELFY